MMRTVNQLSQAMALWSQRLNLLFDPQLIDRCFKINDWSEWYHRSAKTDEAWARCKALWDLALLDLKADTLDR